MGGTDYAQSLGDGLGVAVERRHGLLSSDDSPKNDEVKQDSRVRLCFQDGKHSIEGKPGYQGDEAA